METHMLHSSSITDRKVRRFLQVYEFNAYLLPEVLEQILGTKLAGEEAEEKERLSGLSKEELIEQLLKAKVRPSLKSRNQ